MPTLPVAESTESNRVAIRIRSDVKWPECAVYDTSLPTTIPQQTASMESNADDPSTKAADVPVRARQAFAQAQPSDGVEPPKTKAGGEAATRTQTGKEARGDTRVLDGAANAIWLVWLQRLVSHDEFCIPPVTLAFESHPVNKIRFRAKARPRAVRSQSTHPSSWAAAWPRPCL
jgi:hypothetical protein